LQPATLPHAPGRLFMKNEMTLTHLRFLKHLLGMDLWTNRNSNKFQSAKNELASTNAFFHFSSLTCRRYKIQINANRLTRLRPLYHKAYLICWPLWYSPERGLLESECESTTRTTKRWESLVESNGMPVTARASANLINNSIGNNIRTPVEESGKLFWQILLLQR
jgi:hypothetical protein